MNTLEHLEQCREYLETILYSAEDTGKPYLNLYVMKDDFEEMCRFLHYGKFAPSFGARPPSAEELLR